MKRLIDVCQKAQLFLIRGQSDADYGLALKVDAIPFAASGIQTRKLERNGLNVLPRALNIGILRNYPRPGEKPLIACDRHRYAILVNAG